MARLALVALLCVTATLAGVAADLNFGMDMSDTAYKLVCWYENLKAFPQTSTKNYNKCANGVGYIINGIKNPSEQNKKYYEFYPEKLELAFGKQAPKAMGKLPSEYSQNCNKYLAEPKAAPPANESDALNDGGGDYPYKAFAYCLMQTMRKKNGDSAIEAVKSEKTHARKHWMQALLDRENEFRARHGAEPLKLNKDLIADAQKWSDTNAEECKMYHSKGAAGQYKGQDAGESLAAGMGDDKEIAAYMAADGWYEEINDYPYSSGGYTVEDKALFEKIGHFTQSVWKGSKYVGYGYTYNKDCSKFNRFIAARYFPPGNVPGKYPENVAAPTDGKAPSGA